MKTEYEILWVDDQIDTVEQDIAAIEEFLEEKGVKAQIEPLQSDGTDSIHAAVKEQLKNASLDLIVVDFLMEAEGEQNRMNGEELIHLIRDTDNVYLPVVFYSSNYDGLLQAVAEKKLDGVYLAGRDRVTQKLKLVIESLLRKEQTSKATRGLLMEGVSEIDANLGIMLSKIWAKLEDEKKNQLYDYFQEKVQENLKTSKGNAQQYPKLEEFSEHMATKFVSPLYQTMTRWKVLKHGLKLIEFDKGSRKIFDQLFQKSGDEDALVHLRNKYGHLSRAKLEEIHNDELCVKIRNELRRQMDNLQYLLTNI